MFKAILLISLFLFGVKQIAIAQNNSIDAPYLTKYDLSIKAVKGNYKVKTEINLNKLLPLIGQQKLLSQYSNEILEIAKKEFSEMEAILRFACSEFRCTDSVIAIKRIIHKKGIELEYYNLSFVDSSNSADGFFESEYYCLVADFNIKSSKNMKFRIYRDTGDLGGTSCALYIGDKVSLKYYVDDYNTYDQNLFISNNLFFRLHVFQGGGDEPSHLLIAKKYLK